MCGRYVAATPRDTLAELYEAVPEPDVVDRANFNTAPSQTITVVLEGEEDDGVTRRLTSARWGLVPSWAKDISIGSKLINARVETADTKPSFRSAWRKRRCIVPADGYYEWTPVPDETTGKVRKQPYLMRPSEGGVLSFAGLYELWRDPSKAEDDPDRWLWSVTILTTDATGPAGEIHDRTPLILPGDRLDRWLAPEITDPGAVREVLDGIELPVLEVAPVSTAVNSVRHNGPELIEPIAEPSRVELALT